VDEPTALGANPHWQVAVWALRLGYLALAVIVVGLIVLGVGSTPWVLAVGVIFWLVVAVTSAVNFMWARAQLGRPRPGFVELRALLLRDSLRR